jgi:hypothetical protein
MSKHPKLPKPSPGIPDIPELVATFTSMWAPPPLPVVANLKTGYILFSNDELGEITVLLDIEGEVTTIERHAVSCIARVPGGGWVTVKVAEFARSFS